MGARNVHGLLVILRVVCGVVPLWEADSGDFCSSAMAWIQSNKWSRITIGRRPPHINRYVKW